MAKRPVLTSEAEMATIEAAPGCSRSFFRRGMSNLCGALGRLMSLTQVRPRPRMPAALRREEWGTVVRIWNLSSWGMG